MRTPILLIIFIALFGHAGPAFAKGALHAAERSKTAHSINSNYKTTIIFTNESGEPLRIYWLDFKGNRKLYRKLPAGKIHNQQTFMTHPWLVTDAKDDAIAIYYPDSQPRKVVLTGNADDTNRGRGLEGRSIGGDSGSANVEKNYAIKDFEGKYECRLYDKKGKNDYHYVTIKRKGSSGLEWSNRAGSEWFFTANDNNLLFNVTEDCPYFKTGFKHAKFKANASGAIIGVFGPGGEFYQKQDRFSR